jgi:CrcB protein
VTAFLVLLAGALGAASRYGVERVVTRRGERGWPAGTFVVNVTGCLALGVIAGAVSAAVGTVLGVGLVGSYTTFSAYAVEIVKVDAERSRATAAAYAIGSVLLGVLAGRLGLVLGGLV